MENNLLEEFKIYLTSQGRILSYYYLISQYFNYLRQKNIQYDNINQQDIFQYLIYLQQEKKLEAGTINNHIKALRFFYAYLVNFKQGKKEILDMWYKIHLLEVKQKIHNYINEDELNQIIEIAEVFSTSIAIKKSKLILKLLYYTGLRLHEFIQLKRENISLEKLTIYVRGKIKNQLEREIPIPAGLKKDIEEFFQIENEIKNAFNISSGQLIYLFMIIKQYYKKPLTIHGFRHSYARMLARKGVSVRAAQRLLGHKNIDSTLIYYDIDVEQAKQAFWEKIKI